MTRTINAISPSAIGLAVVDGPIVLILARRPCLIHFHPDGSIAVEFRHVCMLDAMRISAWANWLNEEAIRLFKHTLREAAYKPPEPTSES